MIRWSGVRRILFAAGLVSLSLSVLSFRIAQPYLHEHIRLINSGQHDESYFKAYWAVRMGAAIWIGAFSLILLAFGRGWTRFCALFAGALFLLAVIGSF
jgi:hypothetical protein